MLTRASSKASFPSSVKAIPVDYGSLDSLTAALKGQDAVVSTVGTEGFQGQPLIIDAAIAAGVKRFIPSEFGSDTDNPKTAALPVFDYKIATRKHLEAKIAAGADITYTYVINGPFLDWGIDVGFLLNWRDEKIKLFDGGERYFSSTTLANAGQAVVGVLSHEEETRNKSVFVQDITVSQKKLLEIAKKADPQKKWETVDVSLADVEKDSNEKLARGEVTMEVMYSYIFLAICGEGYGALMEKTDNELLGVEEKTDADVEAIWKKALAGGK